MYDRMIQLKAMKIGVAIASRKRPNEIDDILKRLREQTLIPHRIVLSVTGPEDLPSQLNEKVAQVVMGGAGLCAQRNRAIDNLCTECDVIIFYDDDFIPSRRALQGIRELFSSNANVAAATGLVLDDGINKGGVTLADALDIVSQFDACDPPPARIDETVSTYGCNMAFRMSSIKELRFDERLPLYGWQEDVDFSARVSNVGRVVSTNLFAGVHRGVTKGRSPGRALGYSQIVNPAYLVAKGTMKRNYAAKLMIRNLLANHLRALYPEAYIDRAGRALGNWTAFVDIMKKKGKPENILRY